MSNLYYRFGINWVLVQEFVLKGDRAEFGEKSFRVRPGDAILKDLEEYEFLRPGLKIDEWRKDGQPGGLSGLKENYRETGLSGFIRINGKDYRL